MQVPAAFIVDTVKYERGIRQNSSQTKQSYGARTNAKGVPSGENKEKNLKPCKDKPIIVTPNHILELIDSVLARCDVVAKL